MPAQNTTQVSRVNDDDDDDDVASRWTQHVYSKQGQLTASGPGSHCSIVKFRISVGVHV